MQHVARGTQLAGRLDDGYVVAEGVFILRTLIETRRPVVAVLTEPARASEVVALLRSSQTQTLRCVVYVAQRGVLSGIVGYAFHRGVIAIAARPAPTDPLMLTERSCALVALEDLANHENVGSIVRTVAALGGVRTGIVVNEGCTDPMYRRSVRVSMGHALRQPYAVVRDLADMLASMKHMDVVSIALAPASSVRRAGQHISLDALPAGFGPRKPVLVFGSEAHGLRDRTLDACDHICSIPMAAGVDSLNVNVAVGVVLSRLNLLGETV